MGINTFACPACGSRVFLIEGTAEIAFTGTLDCTLWDADGEIDIDYVMASDMVDGSEDITHLRCQDCKKSTTREEAAAAYDEAYQEYLAALPDPRQMALFE